VSTLQVLALQAQLKHGFKAGALQAQLGRALGAWALQAQLI